MSAAAQTNAAAVAARLRRARDAVQAELAGELSLQAQRAEAVMKREAPKYLSTMTNSIRAEKQSDTEWLVRPHTDYAKWVVHGRKPGKGLPRFFDPASSAIVAWLESKLRDARRAINPRYRPDRVQGARYTAEALELHDRYWMLSRAVKARGIKPNNYVKRTADRLQGTVPDALAAAVRRGLRQMQGGLA